MKTALTIIINLLVFISLNAQSYKQIQIRLKGSEDIELLNQSGIDLEGAISLKQMTAKIYVNESDLAKVNKLGLSYEILIDDWANYYKNLPTLTNPEMNQILEQSRIQYGVTGFGYGSLGGFYSYSEVNAQLDSMHSRYPGLITQKQSIGTTAGGLPIYMVMITNNSITSAKPQASYMAMHHAREPMGMECLIYFMYYLLENYNSNPTVKYIVDNRELYFIPVCNPDGYEYNRLTNPSGGGMWRKNRKNNGDGTYGVDLNRNYGTYAYWNSPNNGSSTLTSDETYRGTAPFSENEISAIKNYYGAHQFKNSISYHTYGNDMIFPYGALNKETPDSIYFREYAGDITGYNGYSSGTDMQTVGYHTRGGSDDYIYDGDTVLNGGKIFAMTPEVGTDFWPPQSEIMPDVQINLLPNLYWARFAGDYVTLKNANFDRLYFKPGDTVSMKPTFRNKGLLTAKNITFEAASLSNYCTILNASQVMDSIGSRSEKTSVAPMKFVISSAAPVEQKIAMTFTIKINGATMNADTINITVGVPTFIFTDTTNLVTSLWTTAGSPVTSPKWDMTTADYHSAPNCYTDSKAGNYIANANITMTSTNPINLAGFTNPKLSFWTRWDFESRWDCGVVQISTDNGSTWNALQGSLTKPGSGIGKQIPAGIPIYDGTHSSWVQEISDLSAYTGKQIKIRFTLLSDGATQRDGWYIDDIAVFYYGALPIELTSFTATTGNNEVLINWRTATEINNTGFEIQRSKGNTPANEWQFLGFVNGRGTSVKSSSYTFTDRKPLQGKQYYRIKQIDANGTFTLYGPVEIDNSARIDFSLEQNYPNPFNPNTVIKYSIPEAGIIAIKLYDILGTETATLLNEYKEAGRYSLNLSSSQLKNKLSSGIYFYTIKAGRYIQTRKMILMK
jgi:carboxypeptidase T